MGVFKFSMKMLKKEYKKAVVYAFTLMFTIMASFIFFEIMNNEHLQATEKAYGGGSFADVSAPLVTMLAFLIIIFCCFMIIFANNFFLQNKHKELAIMSISGVNFIQLTAYLVYQTAVLILIVMPLGLLFGYLLCIITHSIMFNTLGITASIYKVTLAAFTDTLWTIIIILGCVLFYSCGYIYRNDVQAMLSQQTVNEKEDTRIFKFPRIVYVFVYIFGIILMLFSDYSTSIFIIPCVIGVAGTIGIMKYVFPDWIAKIKRKFFIGDKTNLIAVSNLSYSLKESIMLISLYCISCTGMSAILIGQQGDIKNFITGVLGYAVMIILLSVAILYKYISEIMDRKIFFFNLYKLGYVKKQLSKIIRNEVILYYATIIVVPLIYIVIMFLRCFIHGDVTIAFGIILLLVVIVPPIFVGFITYFNYKNVVLKTIEGGIRYE